MGDRFELHDIWVDGDTGPVIAGFSARIPADGITVVAGPSGAGKSTLLRLLNRLDDPDRGAVLLDGRDVREYEVLDLRRRVQLVSQVPVPLPGTVAANVGTEWPELLPAVGLDPALAARDAGVLSVGEAQRMCVARALARRPDALVLDEPTSALDPASKEAILAVVRARADAGTTVVLVTHDPADAERLADHRVVLGPQP